MGEEKNGCVKPAKGPVAPQAAGGNAAPAAAAAPNPPRARVGGEAPDFEANAYVAGKGFQQVRLSDYKGKWVVLCFYPGDFTFV